MLEAVLDWGDWRLACDPGCGGFVCPVLCLFCHVWWHCGCVSLRSHLECLPCGGVRLTGRWRLSVSSSESVCSLSSSRAGLATDSPLTLRPADIYIQTRSPSSPVSPDHFIILTLHTSHPQLSLAQQPTKPCPGSVRAPLLVMCENTNTGASAGLGAKKQVITILQSNCLYLLAVLSPRSPSTSLPSHFKWSQCYPPDGQCLVNHFPVLTILQNHKSCRNF